MTKVDKIGPEDWVAVDKIGRTEILGPAKNGCKRAPHYTVQALRARGKHAVILPHAFGLPAIVAG